MPRAHCGELCVMGKGAGAGVLGPVHDGLDYVPLPRNSCVEAPPPSPTERDCSWRESPSKLVYGAQVLALSHLCCVASRRMQFPLSLPSRSFSRKAVWATHVQCFVRVPGLRTPSSSGHLPALCVQQFPGEPDAHAVTDVAFCSDPGKACF